MDLALWLKVLLRERARVRLLRDVVAATAVVLFLGNCFQVRRFEYLSFEELAGVRVSAAARIAHDDLYFGPWVATEYFLSRAHYELRLRIDETVTFPHVSVELTGAPEGMWIHPRLVSSEADGTLGRIGFSSPCGTISSPKPLNAAGAPTGSRQYTLLWRRCADRRDPDEFVMVFDVVAASGETIEERLPFELKTRGFFLQRALLSGGILQWRAPIQKTTLARGGHSVLTALRVLFGTSVL